MLGKRNRYSATEAVPRGRARISTAKIGARVLCLCLIVPMLASGNAIAAKATGKVGAFKITDSQKEPGAVCRYEGAQLKSITVRAPQIRARRVGHFQKQWVRWTPSIQRKTDGEWPTVKTTKYERVKARLGRFTEFPMKSYEFTGFQSGIYRAAIEIGWFNQRTGDVEGTVKHVVRFHSGADKGHSSCLGRILIPPAGPSLLIAETRSPSQIDLEWVDEADNEEGFKIERSLDGVTFEAIGSAPVDATTYSANTLQPNTSYFFRVHAYNSKGNSKPSNVAAATTLIALPAAPTLGGFSFVPNEITLSWIDNSDNEEGFRIERAELDSFEFVVIATVPADSTTYVDKNRTSLMYQYRVVAYNSTGSVPSIIVEI